MSVRATNSKERFSSRVEAYAKYRPGYPTRMYSLFRDVMCLTAASVIADVGSGTGISAEPLLKAGSTVCCVEPNPNMREAAERMLGHYPGFRSIDGSGEQTSLPDRCADLVFCAQAFHWFDHARAAAEFKRICNPGAHVAIAWNKRKTSTSPFLAAYDDLLVRYGTDYTKVAHEKVALSLAEFTSLFAAPFTRATFENQQQFDLEGLRGRVESSSYTPAAGEKGHVELYAGLDQLFGRFAKANRVTFEYETEVYYGHLP
jgi:ubiquinone/menaquinone biosynthesis C-methylase UbiE